LSKKAVPQKAVTIYAVKLPTLFVSNRWKGAFIFGNQPFRRPSLERQTLKEHYNDSNQLQFLMQCTKSVDKFRTFTSVCPGSKTLINFHRFLLWFFCHTRVWKTKFFELPPQWCVVLHARIHF